MKLDSVTRPQYKGTGATTLLPTQSPDHYLGGSMKNLMRMVAPVLASILVAAPANADSPARERELTCSGGIVFVGQQVRMGNGHPPHVWRNVDPGGSPAAFSFHAASVTAPDGTVVESETWDNASGVNRNHDLVVCSFVIPIGPLTGHTASFVGFFLP